MSGCFNFLSGLSFDVAVLLLPNTRVPYNPAGNESFGDRPRTRNGLLFVRDDDQATWKPCNPAYQTPSRGWRGVTGSPELISKLLLGMVEEMLNDAVKYRPFKLEKGEVLCLNDSPISICTMFDAIDAGLEVKTQQPPNACHLELFL